MNDSERRNRAESKEWHVGDVEESDDARMRRSPSTEWRGKRSGRSRARRCRRRSAAWRRTGARGARSARCRTGTAPAGSGRRGRKRARPTRRRNHPENIQRHEGFSFPSVTFRATEWIDYQVTCVSHLHQKGMHLSAVWHTKCAEVQFCRQLRPSSASSQCSGQAQRAPASAPSTPSAASSAPVSRHSPEQLRRAHNSDSSGSSTIN